MTHDSFTYVAAERSFTYVAAERSGYPLDAIIRDVAGQLLDAHLVTMIRTQLPGHARALLMTRAAEVRRGDVVEALAADQSPTEILDQLRRQLDEVHADLRAYCELGPVPTPAAYEAACTALDRVKGTVAGAGRAALLAYRDKFHRPGPPALGLCVCGQVWGEDGCDEFQSLTNYQPDTSPKDT